MSKMAELSRQVAETNRLLAIMCKALDEVDKRLTEIENFIKTKDEVRVHDVDEFYPENE